MIVLNQAAERTETLAPSVSKPAGVVGASSSAMPSMPPPPPPLTTRTARVASQLHATAASTREHVSEARRKSLHAIECTSTTQGATSSAPHPFPVHAFDFHWTGDDIPANPSMKDLTQFVRWAVFSQNYLHSEVQRLSAVCDSNQTELQRQ